MARLVTQITRCTMRGIARVHKRELNITSSSQIFLPFSRNITTTQYLGAERRYTDKHEWVTVNENVGTIGISEYAQDALGDVVYAQLPDVGTIVKKEDECGALESVKAASEIYSPVTGKVIEKNEAVESKPGLINTSCYEEGWLFKLELSNPDEIKSLMDENSYNEFLKSDPH